MVWFCRTPNVSGAPRVARCVASRQALGRNQVARSAFPTFSCDVVRVSISPSGQSGSGFVPRLTSDGLLWVIIVYTSGMSSYLLLCTYRPSSGDHWKQRSKTHRPALSPNISIPPATTPPPQLDTLCLCRLSHFPTTSSSPKIRAED